MRRLAVICGALAVILAAFPASAKPARCFTTDDGYYPCNFRVLDRKGSFAIAARDRPTYYLVIDQPGFAAGYVNFGDRSIPLPGMYVRQRDDGACWANPETSTKICAW